MAGVRQLKAMGSQHIDETNSSRCSRRFLSTRHGATIGTEVLQGDRKLESSQAICIEHLTTNCFQQKTSALGALVLARRLQSAVEPWVSQLPISKNIDLSVTYTYTKPPQLSGKPCVRWASTSLATMRAYSWKICSMSLSRRRCRRSARWIAWMCTLAQ